MRLAFPPRTSSSVGRKDTDEQPAQTPEENEWSL